MSFRLAFQSLSHILKTKSVQLVENQLPHGWTFLSK